VGYNLYVLLICISLWLKMVTIFSFIYWPFLLLFENCLFSSFVHLFIGLFVLLVSTILSSLILWYQFPVRWITSRSFLLFCSMAPVKPLYTSHFLSLTWKSNTKGQGERVQKNMGLCL
jgi:hypothetical protein